MLEATEGEHKTLNEMAGEPVMMGGSGRAKKKNALADLMEHDGQKARFFMLSWILRPAKALDPCSLRI